jgi:hypothetical protein
MWLTFRVSSDDQVSVAALDDADEQLVRRGDNVRTIAVVARQTLATEAT